MADLRSELIEKMFELGYKLQGEHAMPYGKVHLITFIKSAKPPITISYIEEKNGNK